MFEKMGKDDVSEDAGLEGGWRRAPRVHRPRRVTIGDPRAGLEMDYEQFKIIRHLLKGAKYYISYYPMDKMPRLSED